jgi:hypothetical protein
MVHPLGLAKQWTLNEMGIRVLKYQLTQYLSHTSRKLNSGQKLPVNRCTVMEVYTKMIDGWCLNYHIPSTLLYPLRWFYPGRVILIAKYKSTVTHIAGYPTAQEVPHPKK